MERILPCLVNRASTWGKPVGRDPECSGIPPALGKKCPGGLMVFWSTGGFLAVSWWRCPWRAAWVCSPILFGRSPQCMQCIPHCFGENRIMPWGDPACQMIGLSVCLGFSIELQASVETWNGVTNG